MCLTTIRGNGDFINMTNQLILKFPTNNVYLQEDFYVSSSNKEAYKFINSWLSNLRTAYKNIPKKLSIENQINFLSEIETTGVGYHASLLAWPYGVQLYLPRSSPK